MLELLMAGKQVHGCYRRGSDREKTKHLFSYYVSAHEQLYAKIIWHEVDINDIFSIEDALDGIECVYHCAGFVSFLSSDRKKLMKVNEEGTRNVVNACLNKKIAALCHVSSLATLHNLDRRASFLDEKIFWKKSGQESDYAISKYNAEREVWRGVEEGLKAVIVNPGVIIGPGFWTQSSAKIFQTAFKGNPFYTSGSTGYVGARDVARIMIELVEKRKFGNRYVLIENNYSFKQIFTWINVGLGKRPPLMRVNRFILHVGRIFETLAHRLFKREQILSKAVINAAFNSQSYSSEKLKTELNFEFEGMENLIKKTCQIFLQDVSKRGSSL